MAQDVFISYAREDRGRVEKIAKALDARGVRAWWDPKIQTGAGFRAEISEALASSKAVVVVWSQNSVTSRFVCDEADDGAARGILFPALIDSVDIPLGFRQIQTADLTRWRGRKDDRAFQAFVNAVVDFAKSGRRAPSSAPAPHPKPEEEATPQKRSEKPQKKQKKAPRSQAADANRYTTTGAKQRAGLFFRSTLLTLIAAAGFGAIAYGADFIFAAYRPAFVGALAVLAFLSRYGTFQADRASGAASTHLMSRSFMSLIFFALILLAPLILQGRMYAAALEGVQVRGIKGADINGVSLDLEGKKLLTSSDDGTVRVWDVDTGVERGEFRDHYKDHPDPDDEEKWVWNAAFSPDASLAASAGRDRTVRVWKTGLITPVHTLEGHSRSVYDVVWHPEGEAIASASSDNTIRIWDPETGESVRTLTGHSDSVTALDFSRDGALLASASDDGVVRIWNWRSGRTRNYAGAGGGEVMDVRFSHDGAMVGAITERGHVRVWRSDGMGRVADLDHGARGFSVSFVSGDREIASSGIDGIIRIWSLDDQSMIRELIGHKDAVRALDSTNDGAKVVSGSRDNTARVWDVATGREMQTMGHVKAAVRLPLAIDLPPVLSASRAPVPMNFRERPEAALELLGKGAAIAAVLTIGALVIKGFLWLLRLRPIARWTLTAVLFAAAGYSGLLMMSALPIEALWLWLTLSFVPAAVLALARWGVAGPIFGGRSARRRKVEEV